eukprot:c5881_g1_i1 orf=2-1273(-)
MILDSITRSIAPATLPVGLGCFDSRVSEDKEAYFGEEQVQPNERSQQQVLQQQEQEKVEDGQGWVQEQQVVYGQGPAILNSTHDLLLGDSSDAKDAAFFLPSEIPARVHDQRGFKVASSVGVRSGGSTASIGSPAESSQSVTWPGAFEDIDFPHQGGWLAAKKKNDASDNENYVNNSLGEDVNKHARYAAYRLKESLEERLGGCLRGNIIKTVKHNAAERKSESLNLRSCLGLNPNATVRHDALDRNSESLKSEIGLKQEDCVRAIDTIEDSIWEGFPTGIGRQILRTGLFSDSRYPSIEDGVVTDMKVFSDTNNFGSDSPMKTAAGTRDSLPPLSVTSHGIANQSLSKSYEDLFRDSSVHRQKSSPKLSQWASRISVLSPPCLSPCLTRAWEALPLNENDSEDMVLYAMLKEAVKQGWAPVTP